MTAEKDAVVRRWFARLAKGDPAPELCTPDVEVANWAESPVPGPYRGHEGLQRWWRDVEDSFEQVRFELVEVLDAGGDSVVTTQRLIGRFRHTGIDLDHLWGSVIRVRDGRIASATGYSSPGRAKRAAGVAPG